ncbi:MAG: hypothetical protein ACP5SD_04205, partial [Elusimicrobiales bacterium]
MANLSRVNSWVLPKISSLGIKVYKLKWIKEFIEGYHDYRLTMTFNSKICVGRGIDLKEELAFEKAATELFERASVAFPEFYENPWATAAYPDEEGAKIRAYRELLCVDRGICHHYTGKGFKKLDLDIISEKINLKKLKNKLFKNNIYPYLYEMMPSSDNFAVCFICSLGEIENSKGLIFGFGADKDLIEASFHAFLESLRNAVAVFVSKEKPSVSLEEFKKNRNPEWHIWEYQKEDNIKKFVNNIILNETKNFEKEEVTLKDIKFKEIKSLKNIYPDIPIKIWQAESEKL